MVHRHRIVAKMPLIAPVVAKKYIVELNRHRIEHATGRRFFILTGLLGEMGKSLRAKGAAFGVVDAPGVVPPVMRASFLRWFLLNEGDASSRFSTIQREATGGRLSSAIKTAI